VCTGVAVTLWARLVWITVALGLVVGGFVVASVHRERSAVKEELQRARAREDRLKADLVSIDDRISDLFLASRDLQDIQDTCLFELDRQTAAWNELLADIPHIFYSPSDLDPYVRRAQDMVSDAREIAATCAKI
jgi:heme exporter protein D